MTRRELIGASAVITTAMLGFFTAISYCDTAPPLPPVPEPELSFSSDPVGTVRRVTNGVVIKSQQVIAVPAEAERLVLVTNWSNHAPPEGYADYPDVAVLPAAGERYEYDFGQIVTNRVATMIIDGQVEDHVLKSYTNTTDCVLRRNKLVAVPVSFKLVKVGQPKHR